MADNKVGIIVDAKNNAKGPLGEVSGQLKGLDKLAGTLATGTLALGAAFGTLRLGQAIFELGEVAAQGMRVETAFQQMTGAAGQVGDELLAAMQKASRGTIDNSALMMGANRAMLLGVADSAQEMTKLIEVASVRGKALGLSTKQAFNDVVTGIGRMSPLILDNLGIVTGGEKVFNRYAAAIGKTAKELSDAERKQALFNSVVASTAPLIAASAGQGEDLATKFERMDTSLANAKQSLGELFAPAVAVVAESIARAAAAAVEGFEGMAEAADANKIEGLKFIIGELNERIELQRRMLENVDKSTDDYTRRVQVLQADILQLAFVTADLNEATGETVQAISDAAHPLSIASEATLRLAMAQDTATASANAQADAEANLAAQIKAVAQATSASQARLKGAAMGAVARGMDPTKAFNLYEDLAASVEGVGITMEGVTNSAELTEFFLAQATDQGVNLLDSMFQVDTATKSAAKSAGTLSSAYQAVKGAIDSVLSGALNTGVGVDAESLLPRQDAINEDARRLADVAVNGYASPWADFLQNKFPGMFDMASGVDLKTQAATLLRDFEAGLVPQLIDKETAKARVKRMLLGDAAMAELGQEIAAEIAAEMNIPLADAQGAVENLIGGGDLEGAGKNAAQAIKEGFSVEGVATTAITALKSEITNDTNTEKLVSAGKINGEAWGNAFLGVVRGNVPLELIDILTELVVPGVRAALALDAGLTGAG